jgi:3D (Asp-Asp-Asp) domain-containing protein
LREQISTTGVDQSQVNLAAAFRSWMRRRLYRTACISLFLTAISAVGIRDSSVHAQPQALTPPLTAANLLHVQSIDRDSDANPVVASDVSPASADAAGAVVAAPEPPRTTVVITRLPSAPADMAPESIGDVYQVDENRRETIPFKKVIQLSRSESAGQTAVAAWGENGVLEKTFRITYRGGQPVAFDLIHTRVIKQPVDTVVLAGYSTRGARALPSRSGTYTRTREIDMIATGYSPYEGSGRGICATGIRAGFGVVAVDPRVIPLGSKLYIDGYGYALAGDTGGAIRGDRIDLGLNSHHLANMVGRRAVHVYVMSEGR